MVTRVVVLVLVAVALVSAQPIRPVLPETFEGEGYAHLTNTNGTFWGIGHWAVDQPHGHGIERWEFDTHERHHDVILLQRYDLGFDYAISHQPGPQPHPTCHKTAIKPPMPTTWAWLKDARYRGKHVIDGRTYDEWVHTAAGVTLAVAVEEQHANRPRYFYRGTATHRLEVHFLIFEQRQANASWFNVPDVCKNATISSATEVIPAAEGTADPPRPSIPETFESIGSAHHRSRNDSVWGFGRWAMDAPKGHGIEHWEYEEHAHLHHIELLWRYDLGKEYVVTRDPRSRQRVCKGQTVTPPMPSHWGWIKDASYIGKHRIGEHTYDQWQWKNAGFTLTISVSETDANRPFYFSRISSTENFEVHFIAFEHRPPNDTWFHIPDICKNATEEFTVPVKESPRVILGALNGVCPTAVDTAIAIAKQECHYAFGGIGPCGAGFDNDGLIAKSFASAGRWIPRDVVDQQMGGEGCVGGVQPGDLVFVGSPANHVAMAIGNGMIAECPITGEACRVAPLVESFFNGGCRRYC